ncbi:MAG: Hsp20/alpha crystallin family protein [Pirellula sp.]
MVHFRFPIHQLPSALQDFATDVESIVDQVLKNKSECRGDACDSTEACDAYSPAVDIYELDNQYNLYVDLPGVKTEDVTIEMLDERLVVKGVRQAVEKGDAVNVHRQERASGKFSRSIRLPKQLDSEKIEAHFDNGVLHVVLPKQPKPVARTIEIKTS